MSVSTKNLRASAIAEDVDVLSPVDDLAALPAPYDTNGLEPAFKVPKEEWAKTRCASLDGFIALDTLKRPETKEEEDEFVRKFLAGLEKLFQDANKNALQPLKLTMEFCAKCNTCSEACH
ncbi:MAG: (Fe-S)-binding protein, partial [Gordonibacter sp.]